MKRCTLVVVLAALIITMVPAASQAATSERSVKYGPFTIPGATEAGPGKLENKLRFAVARPCVDCYITSFVPDLVYENGTSATMADGVMLHHTVMTSQFRSDPTCSGTWLGLTGERFFASGNERTPITFAEGYGYRVRWYDSWNLLVDLMNHSTKSVTVYVKVTFTVRPSWHSVQRVRPVWLDIDQCRDSEYAIPQGYSDEHWDWTVNVPGKVMTVVGHVHGHGIAVEATNESEGGVSICRSVATPDPSDPHVIRSMTPCVGDPLAIVRQGQVVRLHSEYQSSHAADDVMGIMLAYIHPS